MAWYLYGVMSADGPATPPAGLLGLDDAPVRFHGGGDLRLIVSDIDRTPTDLQEADPQDTIAAVQRHDEALTSLATVAPLLPVRLGTLVTDRSAADELLDEQHHALADALRTVAGAAEWVVRIDAPEATADEVDTDLTPGHAFFARKRSQREARRDVRERAHSVATELERRLSVIARHARRLSPREPSTVARTAYLVDRESADRFVATAEEAEGVTVDPPSPAPWDHLPHPATSARARRSRLQIASS